MVNKMQQFVNGPNGVEHRGPVGIRKWPYGSLKVEFHRA